MTEEKSKLKFMVCPEGHYVPYEGWNYAKDDSDGDRDADGLPMYEKGLFCHGCDRAYGLSKLRDPKPQ